MRKPLCLAVLFAAAIAPAAQEPPAAETDAPPALRVIVRSSPNHHAPENTAAAAVLSTAIGADYAEIDVRTSRDGVLFLLRDASLERTTGERGTIQTRTAGLVDALDAGALHDAVFAGESVPRLDAYLEETGGDIAPCVTLRHGRPEDVAAALTAAEADADCIIRAGTGPKARAFREALPEAKITLPVQTIEGARRARNEFGADIVECRWGDLKPEFAAACREAGLEILIAYDGDDPEVCKAIADGDADYVLTSRPELFATPRPLPIAPETPADPAATPEAIVPEPAPAPAEPEAPAAVENEGTVQVEVEGL